MITKLMSKSSSTVPRTPSLPENSPVTNCPNCPRPFFGRPRYTGYYHLKIHGKAGINRAPHDFRIVLYNHTDNTYVYCGSSYVYEAGNGAGYEWIGPVFALNKTAQRVLDRTTAHLESPSRL